MFSKIYFRFFIGFLITTLIVISILVIFFIILVHPKIKRQESTIHNAMHTWEKTLSIGGEAAYKEIVNNSPPGYKTPVFLLDERGNDLLNRNLPMPAMMEINRYIKEKRSDYFTSPFVHIKKIKDSNNYTRYIVGFSFNDESKFLMENPPHSILIKIFLSVVVCGLLCLFLAKYLTKPISSLQNAVKTIANGDLNTKIDSNICQRNDELGMLAKTFNDMTTKLQLSKDNQKKLLRNISHELRSPLARAQVAVEIASQKNKDDDKEIKVIEKEIFRINSLIQQILTLPTLGEHNNYSLEDVIDIKILLEEIIKDASFESHNRNMSIKFLVDSQEYLINTYGELLHSALENIIRNSIKYSPDDSEIDIQLYEVNNTYKITVEDQGPGVSEDKLEEIFAPFFRDKLSQNNTDSSKEGFGLGLAIAAGAIEVHSGTIQAENIISDGDIKGLKISISLPIMN